MNRGIGSADPIRQCLQLSRRLRVVVRQQRILVVGNGNIDVGSKTPTRKPGQLGIDRPDPLKTERPKIPAAMAQQCGDLGNQSAPQKFVHLVGCREPKAHPAPWVRPRAAPTKP
jgi:hypothetical protein